MEHDGENLKKAIKESGLMVGFFGEQMGVGRNTPTRWFDTPSLPIDKLMKAAKLLKREPGDLFPRLKKAAPVAQPFTSNVAEDAPRPHYSNGADALQKCTEERQTWQNKAYEWMEKYAMLLENHNRLLAERLEVTAKKAGEWLEKGNQPLLQRSERFPTVAQECISC